MARKLVKKSLDLGATLHCTKTIFYETKTKIWFVYITIFHYPDNVQHTHKY